MGTIYRASGLEAALNLAKQFKTEGKYHLFRGQAQNWPVVPTSGRLSKEEFECAKQKLERLLYFFHTNKLLKKYARNYDWFYAVAQHYGLPTNYIDFSEDPEVAAFFATNSKSNIVGSDSVIICLDENDFSDFVRFTKVIYEKDKVIPPCIVRVDVDNLWRLQAQKGAFVYTPYSDTEFYYDFDRIVFPYTEPYDAVVKSDVYPDKKSELEILLDQFFNSEERIAGQKRFEKFIKENNIPSHTVGKPSFDHLLKNRKSHYSWRSKQYSRWNFVLKEEWNRNRREEVIKLKIEINKQVSNKVTDLKETLIAFVADKQIQRTDDLVFKLATSPKLPRKTLQIISRSCSRIWDGTRTLPYSDEEIFSIIANYILLEISNWDSENILFLSDEEPILLELTNAYGSLTRCYASPSKIISAFRSDINNTLIDSLSENLTSEILLQINKPRLLFDFKKLIELFKEEMVLYQVFHNSEKDEPVIFYTPAQVFVMGYA